MMKPKIILHASVFNITDSCYFELVDNEWRYYNNGK